MEGGGPRRTVRGYVVRKPRLRSHTYIYSSSCVVCRENYADGDRLAWSAVCGHSHHLECLLRWEGGRRCPLCRGGFNFNSNTKE